MVEENEVVSEQPTFRIDVVLKNFQAASSEEHMEDVGLSHFIGAYEELNKFIGLLGKIFHFVQIDVREKTNKLQHLLESDPKSYRSVRSMVMFENERRHYPGSKALLALHRALEFIVAFLTALARSTNDESVSAICRETYDVTLARFHNWVIRKAVGLAMYTLPSRGQLITSIQGSVPEENHIREILSNVVAKTQVVYSRVHTIYTDYGLHTLL
ncbi:glycolipid transfer protein [Dictyocaulus viviparus]|uniref:Glycolipid transfer protein n=1 Tax=Dictyocaulus viviparus TaxID=29172 RepID=A0A0D8XDE5_DICVI|nr:glycolipid transfer protein [Dictyocaulus viviparus]